MMKPLLELTDRELERCLSKAYQKVYDYEKEQSRRMLIERYGTDKPELNEYSLSISADCPLTVFAQSEEDAIEIATINLCIDQPTDQIEINDSPEVTIDDIQLVAGSENKPIFLCRD